MGMKLNEDGVKHARQLIKDGKYKVDTDWSKAQPSTADENNFLDQHDENTFGQWYLGIDTDPEGENPKEHYDFPYGDFEFVHRSGLIAAQQRAGQYDYDDVGDAADKLVQLIDEQEK